MTARYACQDTLKNLEFVEFTLIYRVKSKILRIAGMAPFLSKVKLINNFGEDLFELHFPNKKSEKVGRAEIMRLVEKEILTIKDQFTSIVLTSQGCLAGV